MLLKHRSQKTISREITTSVFDHPDILHSLLSASKYCVRFIHYKCAPVVVKSLISLFKRPFILRHTLGEFSSDSDSELSLSATKRSMQPSGRGSGRGCASESALIFFVGFVGIGLSDPEREGRRGRDVERDVFVRDW